MKIPNVFQKFSTPDLSKLASDYMMKEYPTEKEKYLWALAERAEVQRNFSEIKANDNFQGQLVRKFPNIRKLEDRRITSSVPEFLTKYFYRDSRLSKLNFPGNLVIKFLNKNRPTVLPRL